MLERKQLQEAKIGENVQLGIYQGEIISWRVLDRRDGKLFLISEKCLDNKPYDVEWDNTTWNISSLRQWLNETFLGMAFSKEEQEIIASVLHTNADNPAYHTPGGHDTEDKVFLLSVEEAEQYFPSNEERRAGATEYTKKEKAYVDQDGYTWWWLRTMGFVSNCCTQVKNDGTIDLVGRLGNVTGCGNTTAYVLNGIRPAIWINVD